MPTLIRRPQVVSVEVWLKNENTNSRPQITGFAPPSGATFEALSPGSEVLRFHGDVELSTTLTVAFSQILFFKLSPVVDSIDPGS